MSDQRDSGPLPNRWLRCPRKSNNIIADRFLAFKTPLDQRYKDKMPLECMFPPDMLFSYCKATNIKLGLWIDLTNTKRFYDRKIVESFGAAYVKLQCRGHGERPSPEQTHSFIEIVDEFLNEHPLDIIGVHCTHGFNRTGFLIISYLVERMDCSVEAALDLFSKARPPGIYKQDYINELFSRYGDSEDAVQAPNLPEWCLEFDDSNRDDVASGSGGSGAKKRGHDNLDEDDQVEDGNDNKESMTNGETKKKKRRRERFVKDAKFMDGISGVDLVTDPDVLGEVQRKVQDMCGWQSNGFPGAQPVSMDRENLELLFKMHYLVSWKADGTRYMMLINGPNEIFFFDRNFSCFQVRHLTFPKLENLREHLTDTLLDGEMVLDNDHGVIKPRYLVYDIVQFCGNNIGKEDFTKRLKCITKEIIDARHKAITCGVIDKRGESFGVHHKPFWGIEHTESLLSDKFAKTLLHEPDGLIFQPVTEPYTGGQCNNVLKWKPHNLNSVDFRLGITIERGEGILPKKIGLLYVGGLDQPFGKINFTKVLGSLNNKIIECSINTKGEWEFMRERIDKTLPNSFNTAKAVVKSIRFPITDAYLIQAIRMKGFRPDKEKMPPPVMARHQQQPPQQQEHQRQHQQRQHHQQQHHQRQQHQQQQHQQQHHQQQHHQEQHQQNYAQQQQPNHIDEHLEEPEHELEHQPQEQEEYN